MSLLSGEAKPYHECLEPGRRSPCNSKRILRWLHSYGPTSWSSKTLQLLASINVRLRLRHWIVRTVGFVAEMRAVSAFELGRFYFLPLVAHKLAIPTTVSLVRFPVSGDFCIAIK